MELAIITWILFFIFIALRKLYIFLFIGKNHDYHEYYQSSFWVQLNFVNRDVDYHVRRSGMTRKEAVQAELARARQIAGVKHDQ